MKQRLLSLFTTQRVLCALALALSAGAAHAFFGSIDYISDITVTKSVMESNFNWVRKNQKCGPAGVNAAGFCIGQGANSSTQTPALLRGASAASLSTGKPFATKKGIYRLVAPVPAENQPEAAKMFTMLITTFDQTIPRTYGIPANNLASAYAAVLAGSYAAYTNRPFPENAVKPLFEQVQQGMLDNPQISQVSLDEKAAMYQVWVGAGMYLLGWQAELVKHPNSEQQAKMQKAGANALRAALAGTDPSRVRFTARGMEVH